MDRLVKGIITGASTYETILPSYEHRIYPIVPATRQFPYMTLAQRYATMYALQKPSFLQDTRNVEFCIIANEEQDNAAVYMRTLGPLYNVPSLYLQHRGREQPLTDNAQVCRAIQQLLVRNAIAHQLTPPGNVDSSAPFESHELKCLLHALVNGTIQPDLFHGQALRVPLVDQLMHSYHPKYNSGPLMSL